MSKLKKYSAISQWCFDKNIIFSLIRDHPVCGRLGASVFCRKSNHKYLSIKCVELTSNLAKQTVMGSIMVCFRVTGKFHLRFNTSVADRGIKLPHGKIDSKISHGETLWKLINSLASDAIWRLRSPSTWAQVMACYPRVPSHFLNQCWLIINEARCYLAEVNFTETILYINHYKVDENYIFKNPARDQWFNSSYRLVRAKPRHDQWVNNKDVTVLLVMPFGPITDTIILLDTNIDIPFMHFFNKVCRWLDEGFQL